jgi:hypothetical protein
MVWESNGILTMRGAGWLYSPERFSSRLFALFRFSAVEIRDLMGRKAATLNIRLFL